MLRATRLLTYTSSKRGFATVVDASKGFKVSAVDNGQPTSSVTVLLKAGSRYESKPGVAHTLSNFAFKSTGTRSALGTVREAELYGGVLSSSLSREHLALTAEFLRGDEAYFVDVLASFIASPKFTRHELNEYVFPAVHSESSAAGQSAPTHALEVAHALAFRNGLGYSLYADTQATGNITAEDVRELHTRAVGNPSNVAILGTGISTESLAKLFEDAFSAHKTASASAVPATPAVPATTYHGGSARVAAAHGPQTIFVGFGSTASTSVHALHALAAHLNPAPALKWASSAAPLAPAIPAGVHARSVLLPYTDATLIGVVLEGNDAGALKEGAKAVVSAFKDAAAGKVGKEELARAVARAKFQLATSVEAREGYVGVFGPKVLKGEVATVQSALDGVQGVSGTALSQVAGDLIKSKPTFVAVGDLHVLPYADEIGLNA
ncbi:LuxS/MPP-like metallohydrolase [Multifurca ochricompacta]|uniref:Cytochrome b-c1 complex subunit 2, mitochondrial n=1 Tax=Multifurca ochricompacta TaxID=376703 RepID=A0AAD4QJ16_9AGAM|nr:LuxS/MPP-like metallohydrolase [Multifurca ochricompacta]